MAGSDTWRGHASTLVLALLAALLWPASAALARGADASPAPARTSETGALLLASRLAPDGSPLPGVVVYDEQGRLRREVTLPAPVEAVATPRSHQALVRTEDGSIFLVDAATGTARRVAIPAVTAGTLALRSPRFPAAMTERWALLGDTALHAAYLVDLQTDAALDLTTLNPQMSPILGATIAPDNSAVLVDTGADAWLVPTAKPQRARRLGGIGASFSDDGQRLVYTQRGAGTSVEVVVAHADGSAPTVVARYDLAVVARFVPASRGKELVLITGRQVSEVTAATRRSRTLVALSGTPGMPAFAPSGRRLLLEEAEGTSDQAAVWRFVDLATGRVQTLSALAGKTVYPATGRQRWLLPTDMGTGGVGKAGSSLVAVDLESGQVRRLLNPENGVLYQLPGARSGDGRYTALPAVPPTGQSRVYLLDAEHGAARTIAQGAGVAAVISPDGRWVAVGTMARTQQKPAWALKIVPVAGAVPGQRTASSAMPLAWVNP